jgi:hypothetical protein
MRSNIWWIFAREGTVGVFVVISRLLVIVSLLIAINANPIISKYAASSSGGSINPPDAALWVGYRLT